MTEVRRVVRRVVRNVERREGRWGECGGEVCNGLIFLGGY